MLEKLRRLFVGYPAFRDGTTPQQRYNKLPPFGSVVACRACGSPDLSRRYDDGWFAGDHIDLPFMWVNCNTCGWCCGERLKDEGSEP